MTMTQLIKSMLMLSVPAVEWDMKMPGVVTAGDVAGTQLDPTQHTGSSGTGGGCKKTMSPMIPLNELEPSVENLMVIWLASLVKVRPASVAAERGCEGEMPE